MMKMMTMMMMKVIMLVTNGNDGDSEGLLKISFSSQNWKTKIQISSLHQTCWPFVIFWPKLNTCSQNLD